MNIICKILLFILWTVPFISCHQDTPSNDSSTSLINLPDTTAAGKLLFESGCVRCHGMDGSGLTGPSLRRTRLKYAPDLAAFTNVVHNGIPGTGMPSNWSINEEDCRHLYAYIQFIQNQVREIPKGDTSEGRRVYAHAGCNSCHIMYGAGNSFGPDLTDIGASRNASYLKQAILDPAARLPESTDMDNGYGFSLYLPVKIITSDGTEMMGLRINEDTYTIQIKDANNHYHSFNKELLKSVEKLYGQSLMPSYKDKLSEKDVENLVAYLYKSMNQ